LQNTSLYRTPNYIFAPPLLQILYIIPAIVWIYAYIWFPHMVFDSVCFEKERACEFLEGRVKIEHIAIWCKDLDGLRKFYETYFDAVSNKKYENEANGFESYFLRFKSGARLELMCLQSIPQSKNDPYKQFTGLIHLAISVRTENKVDELTNELRKAGHEIIDGPRRTGDGYYESVVLDPENNRIEITA